INGPGRTLSIGAGGIDAQARYKGDLIRFDSTLSLGDNQTWRVVNAGTTLSSSGSISQNGRNLTLTGDGAFEFSGSVSGGGMLSLDGTRLLIGAAGLSSTNVLGIAAASTINTQGNSASFSSGISGNGDLTKAGNGVLTLTGDSPNFFGRIIVK